MELWGKLLLGKQNGEKIKTIWQRMSETEGRLLRAIYFFVNSWRKMIRPVKSEGKICTGAKAGVRIAPELFKNLDFLLKPLRS